MRERTFLIGFVTAVVMAFGSDAIHAQQWPQKNITMIVPFAAGGSTDIMARLLGEKLATDLGQSIVIENRPGAGSNIGAAAAAKAAPDGYTFLLATSTMAANVSLYKNMGFDLARDLIPITQLTRIPNVLTVNPGVPANNMTEFIAYVKANNGKLNFGSSGNGASQHLAAEMFKKMADVDMVHVPYKGGAQATNDLVAGHIQVVFAPLVEVLSFIEGGKLRALGVTTKDRAERLPHIPAIAETLPGFEISLWNGLFAPAGTPQAIIDRMATASRKAMADPALQKQVADQGSMIVSSSPSDFKPYLASEIAKWGELVKLSGAKID